MTSPGNQHCADCIGTLSFPIYEERSRLFPTAWFIFNIIVNFLEEARLAIFTIFIAEVWNSDDYMAEMVFL